MPPFRLMLRRLSPLLAALWLFVAGPSATRAGLVFDFQEGAGLQNLATTDPILYQQVRQGFIDAAAIWQGVLHDNVTLHFQIDYDSLGANVIGRTSSAYYIGTYTEIRDALQADAQSSIDLTAANSLPNTPSVVFRTNDRSGALIIDNDADDPNDGNLPGDQLSDAFTNNTLFYITSANVRALNILPPGDENNTDASITFSKDFAFDFDRSDGIGFGLVDFIGTAAHEIGHALGFASGIDVVDYYTGAGDGAGDDLNGSNPGIGTLDPYVYFTVLDLFRSSSAVPPGTYDWITGGSPGLTIDGGNTFGALFSTGMQNGDGRQASHWKDNASLGIMDPTLSYGELAVLRSNDLLALDVIGWDLQAVPEPNSLVLCSSAAAAWFWRRRRGGQATSGTPKS